MTRTTRPSGSTPSVLLIALLVGAVVLAPSVAASAPAAGVDQSPVPSSSAPQHQRCPDDALDGGSDGADSEGAPGHDGWIRLDQVGSVDSGPEGIPRHDGWTDEEDAERESWTDQCPPPADEPDRCDTPDEPEPSDEPEHEAEEQATDEDETEAPPPAGPTSSPPNEVAAPGDPEPAAQPAEQVDRADARTAPEAGGVEPTSARTDAPGSAAPTPPVTSGTDTGRTEQALAGSTASGVAAGSSGSRLEAVVRSARSPAALSLAGALMVAVFLLFESRLSRHRPRTVSVERVARRRRPFDR